MQRGTYEMPVDNNSSDRLPLRRSEISLGIVTPMANEEVNAEAFVHDTLADGRPFRVLTVVDHWSRQSPVLEAGVRMSGETVGRALEGVLSEGPGPRSITVDHGTEFQSRALEDWAYRRGVQLDCIQPGTPVENTFIESFNGRL